MPADFFNGAIVEVTSVTHEASANRVSVLQTIEDLLAERELAALSQLLLAGLLVGRVDRVEPDMVVSGVLICHMLLELDDVAVGNDLSVGRRQERSGISVNSLCAERGDDARGHSDREGEESDALHGNEVVGLLCYDDDRKERREGLPATEERRFSRGKKSKRKTKHKGMMDSSGGMNVVVDEVDEGGEGGRAKRGREDGHLNWQVM